MKLRIENQTIRFRLSPRDIETLEREGRLSESLSAPKWSYAIESGAFEKPQLETENQALKVLMPASQLASWLNSPAIEWQVGHVLIEKDLKP